MSYGGGRTEIGKCLKEEIVTPGDTVGVTVANAVTSDTVWQPISIVDIGFS